MKLIYFADDHEEMTDKYSDKGTMLVLENDGIKAECMVTDDGTEYLKSEILRLTLNTRG